MNKILTKRDLNKSIELVSEIELDENDFEQIFNKFANFLNKQEIIQRIKENVKKEIKENDKIEELMRKIVKKLKEDDLNELLNILMKNESLIEFIQDLFLEKLL
ncbi:MAG: hypothetical protein ACP6IY_06795 [Promethearchaeia archaeon]